MTPPHPQACWTCRHWRGAGPTDRARCAVMLPFWTSDLLETDEAVLADMGSTDGPGGADCDCYEPS